MKRFLAKGRLAHIPAVNLNFAYVKGGVEVPPGENPFAVISYFIRDVRCGSEPHLLGGVRPNSSVERVCALKLGLAMNLIDSH